jgi:Flp pilus assembly protein TadG
MRPLFHRPSRRTARTSPTGGPTPDQPERAERGRGQALVEFAMVLPVFVLLVAGMFDFGLGIYSDLTLVNAAREGARLGAIEPGDTAAIEAHVRAMADNLDSDKLTVDVDCMRPSGSSFTSCSHPAWQPGDATIVTVGYSYRTFFPLLFGTEIPLSSEARMRIE